MPNAHPLATHILQPHALDIFDHAAAVLEATGHTDLRQRLLAARDELLAELEPLALLLADAGRVTQGDAAAVRRFETILSRVADGLDLDGLPDDPDDPAEWKSAGSLEGLDPTVHGEDPFVRVEPLMSIGIAAGALPGDADTFQVFASVLEDLGVTLSELKDLSAAALAIVERNDPAPAQTMAWRGKPNPDKPRKPKKPKPPTKPKKRVNIKVKIKDTHHAFVSCYLGALYRARAEASQVPRFTVTSLQPADACPGQVMLIHGTNFGTAGTVAFKTAAGSPTEYMAVNANSWTNTLISVTVPAWARPGPLQLHVIDHTFNSCMRRWPVYRLPAPPQNTDFTGGLPDVFDLRVNGLDTYAWAKPNTFATISWVTTPGTVSIDIRNETDPSKPHWIRAGLPAGTSSIAWTTPDVSVPTRHVIALTVTNHCGAFTRELVVQVTVPATVTIEGMEVTQGIQKYSLMGDPSNTIPTVEAKDTIVRLYVTSDREWFGGNLVTQFTAALYVDGFKLAPINQCPPGSYTGGNPYIDLRHRLTLNREDTNSTFNFRIPAALAAGTKTLAAVVTGSTELGPVWKNYSMPWTWSPKQALKVRYVCVSYKGTLISDADARSTVVRAFDLLPSPPQDIAPAWLTTWNTGADLTTDDGKSTLLGHLMDQHNCTFSEWLFPWEDDCPDDDGALWVAVVPDNVGGRARSGKNTCYAGWAQAGKEPAAHEIGHLLCLQHVNQWCGTGEHPDPSTSCVPLQGKGYASLPIDGFILHVVFDPWANAVLGFPRYDFMSYACNRWPSETHWMRLYSLF